MGAPLAQLYCEEDKAAEPILALHGLGIGEQPSGAEMVGSVGWQLIASKTGAVQNWPTRTM